MRKSVVIDLGFCVARVTETGQSNWSHMTLMMPASDDEGIYSPAASVVTSLNPDQAKALAHTLLEFAGSAPAHGGEGQ
jgi:hypothetical protein